MYEQIVLIIEIHKINITLITIYYLIKFKKKKKKTMIFFNK